MVRFETVENDQQIATVETLAGEIWHQHYPTIITREQIIYMLERFQSFDAIREQLTEGYHYALIRDGDAPAGYLAVQCDAMTGDMFLSKVYLHERHRGKGAGYAAMHYIANEARRCGCRRLWLTVNRMNKVAIQAYKKWGFTITGEVVADIGNGYVMDDFRMEKSLEE